MKNIFKLMGIALISCSLFAACGDKTPEGEVDDGTLKVDVTFNGTAYNTFNSMVATTGTSGGQNYTLFDFHPVAMQNATTIEDLLPGLYIMAGGNTAATYTSSEIDAYGYLTGDVIAYEFWNESLLQDQSGNLYGDWWAQNATVEITKLDLTAKLASFKSNGTLFDAMDALVNGNPISQVAKADMVANVSNVTMQ